MPRAFFRCFDCLSVFAEQHDLYSNGYEFTKCPCGGETNFLGYVSAKPIYNVYEMPACDGRCTEARGNCCNCACGGVNHGTGMLVMRRERLDIETSKYEHIDYEYANYCRGIRQRLILANPEIVEIEEGRFVNDKIRWWKAEQIRRKLNDAKWAMTKTKRNKLFQEALAL